MSLSVTNVAEQLKNTLSATLESTIEQLPLITAGLLLVLAGWVVARIARSLVIKSVKLLNRFLGRFLTGRSRAVVLFSDGVTTLLGGVVFWIILFVFITAALRIAGFSGLVVWLERIVDYLPAILTGGLIILVGYILSLVVKDITLAAAKTAQFSESILISRFAQTVTFLTALIIGMDQIGVNVTFITTMLGVTTAAILAGFALAFGLGAKLLVSNLIAAHYLRDMVEAGQRVRIGEWEGVVLDVSPTAIILDTAEGRISIPAKFYHEQPVSVLLEEVDNA